MGPKKKTVRNAYYFFMEKVRNDKLRENPARTFSMAETAQLCGPMWQAMTPEEKKVYEDKAKKEKARVKGLDDMKFTTTGLTLSEVEMKEREIKEKQNSMIEDIRATVGSLDLESLPLKPFFFIHVNFFCECENGEFIPAEVAISRFTLKNGVEEYYHEMINPGELPIGYHYNASKRSDETHGIPTPPSGLGEEDFGKIFRDIFFFLTKDGDKKTVPPLYTVNEFLPETFSFIKKICNMEGYDDDYFKIYDLVQLFFELKNRAASLTENSIFPAKFLAENEINKDSYAYVKNICCYWHEGSETLQHCSLSRARRWGFHIADHCCPDLKINFIPDQHLPSSDKYFCSEPCETFQPVWPRKKKSKAPKEDEASTSQQAVQPLRQPYSACRAVSEGLPKTDDVLVDDTSQFPPLGRRLGANFGKR